MRRIPRCSLRAGGIEVHPAGACGVEAEIGLESAWKHLQTPCENAYNLALTADGLA